MDKTLLIIDDALFMRELLRDALDDLFGMVYEAENSEQAMLCIKQQQPDLITLDLTLDAIEPITGLSLLRTLLCHNPKSCILVISALNQPWLQNEVLSEGAFAYIPKPFDKTNIRNIALKALTNGGRKNVSS
jgi:DNA-binding NtrC family response regulator